MKNKKPFDYKEWSKTYLKKLVEKSQILPESSSEILFTLLRKGDSFGSYVLREKPERTDEFSHIEKDFDTLPFTVKVFSGRIAVLNNCFNQDKKVSFAVIMLLTSLPWMDTPGQVVMLSSALYYYMLKNNVELLTLREVCNSVIPYGINPDFSKDTMELWDAQKVAGDNGLDTLNEQSYA